MRGRNRTSHTQGRRPSFSGPPRILAINPGVRYTGVAFLVGRDLVRADVKHVRGGGTKRSGVVKKAEAILRRWIGRYGPDILAVEQPLFAQSMRSRTLQKLVEAITALGRRERITIRKYSPMAARRLICKEGRPTRLRTAQILSTEYFPWLALCYEREVRRPWYRERYWTTMFDAIAVGLTCAEGVTRKDTSRKAA